MKVLPCLKSEEVQLQNGMEFPQSWNWFVVFWEEMTVQFFLENVIVTMVVSMAEAKNIIFDFHLLIDWFDDNIWRLSMGYSLLASEGIPKFIMLDLPTLERIELRPYFQFILLVLNPTKVAVIDKKLDLKYRDVHFVNKILRIRMKVAVI